MISRIDKLIKESGINDKQFLKEAGLPSSALTEWRKGKAKPSLDAVTKIANYFDVSIDYLVRGSSLSGTEINANLSSVFCGTNALTRYSCYIWKALNDTLASHELLEYLINHRISDRKSDWVILYKQCILDICEDAKIVHLEQELDNDEYREAREVFLASEEICQKFDSFEAVWNEHGKFISSVRNRIAHFDSERDEAFFELIKTISSHKLIEYKNTICDFNSPIFLNHIETLYRRKYDKDGIDDFTAFIESLNVLKCVMEPLIEVLLALTEYFFVNFTVYKEVEQGSFILVSNGKQPQISPPSTAKIAAQSGKNYAGDDSDNNEPTGV